VEAPQAGEPMKRSLDAFFATRRQHRYNPAAATIEDLTDSEQD
jgi:hypothetical protein